MKGARQIMPYSLRMPVEIREWLEGKADDNARSLNGEILTILKEKKKEEEREQHQAA